MLAAAPDIDSHSATAAEFRVQLAHFRRHFGPDYHSFTTQFATFVMVNSETMVAAENHPNFGRGSTHAALAVGNESEAQWAWLESTLAEARAGPRPHILPVMHHPPFLETPDEPAQYFNWPRVARARLLALLRRYGVTQLLCGHTHTTTVVTAGEMTVYTVGGTARTTDGNGCGYSTLTLNASAVDVRYSRLNDPSVAPCCNWDLTAPVGGTCPRCLPPLPDSGFASCPNKAPATGG